MPAGWEKRTIPVSHPIGTRDNTGLCIEAHDLAASKLVAYRDKDRAFVTTLLAEELIDGIILIKRVESLPVSDDVKERLDRWVRVTLDDLLGSD